MRRLIGRLSAYYGRHAVAIDLFLIAAGATALRRRLEDVHGRLDALEERGLTPIDDLVTLRDLAKVEGPLITHHRALVDAGLLPEHPQPLIEPETSQEAAEATTAVALDDGSAEALEEDQGAA